MAYHSFENLEAWRKSARGLPRSKPLKIPYGGERHGFYFPGIGG